MTSIIYLTATTRTNRKDFPKELAKTTPAIKRLKQGESKFLRKGEVVASVWMDKKPVTFLSTYSNPEGTETVKRKQRVGPSLMSLLCQLYQNPNMIRILNSILEEPKINRILTRIIIES